MSDPSAEPSVAAGSSPAPAPTAGRLLREAREKQGLHIAALAAAIKVTPKKLEALESDRFDELPDATFTRALAQTVCRALKTDPAPVMQLLPPPAGHRLEQVGGGLNAPFRERPGALVQRDWLQLAASPVFWIVGLILVATIAIYMLPAQVTALALGRAPVVQTPAPTPRGVVEPGMPPESADQAASPAAFIASPDSAAAPAGSAPSLSIPLPSASSVGGISAGSSVAAENPSAEAMGTMPPGLLQFRMTQASWVEVIDSRGKPLLSRLLNPGELVAVDGVPPFKVSIGNAAGTQLLFRGQPTELQAFTRDNVARLELK